MLILSRKVQESLVIGDSVKVTIRSIRGGTVHIGIEAPQDIAVDRLEVREAKARERHPDADSYDPEAL